MKAYGNCIQQNKVLVMKPEAVGQVRMSSDKHVLVLTNSFVTLIIQSSALQENPSVEQTYSTVNCCLVDVRQHMRFSVCDNVVCIK